MTEHETKIRDKEGQRGRAGATSAWDYVVVGVGSANCVLADRFSGSSSKRLLKDSSVNTVIIERVEGASDVAMFCIATRKDIDTNDERCAKVEPGLSTVLKQVQATLEE